MRRPERHPACRRREARPGFRMERENLFSDAKGQATSGSNREGESTEAERRPTASPIYGAILLLAFALGRAIPILLGASAVGWLESLRVLTKHQKVFEIVGAVTLIASGLYMLNAYYF